MSFDEMRRELSRRFEALKSGNPEGEISRSAEEIEGQIKRLADLSMFPPEGVEKGEEEVFRWWCRGGISMGRWVLGEEMGRPPHEVDILRR